MNITNYIVTAIMHSILFYHPMGYNGDKIWRENSQDLFFCY